MQDLFKQHTLMRHMLINDPQPIGIDRQNERIAHLSQRPQACQRQLVDNLLRFVLQHIAASISMAVHTLRNAWRANRAKATDRHIRIHSNCLSAKLQPFIHRRLGSGLSANSPSPACACAPGLSPCEGRLAAP